MDGVTTVPDGGVPHDADYMPPTDAATALGSAMHDENDLCNANYVVPFEECEMREADIADAMKLLFALHRDDWTLVRRPVSVPGMGL